jgi:hypothetical protein
MKKSNYKKKNPHAKPQSSQRKYRKIIEMAFLPDRTSENNESK